MATPANTVNIFDADGAQDPSIRESLADWVSNVEPNDTRMVSTLARERAMSHIPEWQIDAYNAENLTARPYGDTFEDEVRRNTERRKTTLQTIHRGFKVADEEDAVDHAGFTKRLNREKVKAMIEQKIDIEKIIVRENQAMNAPSGDNGITGQTPSLMAFLSTNTIKGVGGADGGWNATTKQYDARTNGTEVAFTEDMLIDILSKLWTQSGGISGIEVMTNDIQKNKFNKFAGIAAQRIQNAGMKQASVIGAADTYLSNFGQVTVVLNRHMRQREIFVVRPDKMMLKTFWWLRDKMRPSDGNYKSYAITSSFGLCVKDERAQAGIFDLSTA